MKIKASSVFHNTAVFTVDKIVLLATIGAMTATSTSAGHHVTDTMIERNPILDGTDSIRLSRIAPIAGAERATRPIQVFFCEILVTMT